jgi:hypothetical protein
MALLLKVCISTRHFTNADKMPMRSGWPSHDQEMSRLLLELTSLQQRSQQCGSRLRILVFWLRLLADATTRKPAIDSLRAGRSRDRISVEARFSAAVQTGPGAHPSLLYNGYRSITGGKAAGAWRWPPTPSIAEPKERVELPLLPLWDLVACSRVTFTFNIRLCKASCKPFRVFCAPKDHPSFKSLPSHSTELKNLTGLVLTKPELYLAVYTASSQPYADPVALGILYWDQ